MDGAILSEPERPLIRTGPIELRDRGPNGRPLGTHADCVDEETPWELHRGELVEKLMGHECHSAVMVLLGALFANHKRDDCSAYVDIDCVLDDEFGESLRVPDVALIRTADRPKTDGPLRCVPIVAVEVRATQSEKHLREKVKLYLEHDWPTVWIVHVERQRVEIVQKGSASVTYTPGANVPLVPELDKYGLAALPVNAFFDEELAMHYIREWVRLDGRKEGFSDGQKVGFSDGRKEGFSDGVKEGLVKALFNVLITRNLEVPASVRKQIVSCTDLDTLQRWFTLALTATNIDEFVRGMG